MANSYTVPTAPPPRLDGIQLLRGIAALTVVTNHIPLLANGAWGVDLFFVISGFIMCYVTETSARHFFARRLIRVAPLYWADTLGVFAVALVLPRVFNHTRSDATRTPICDPPRGILSKGGDWNLST